MRVFRIHFPIKILARAATCAHQSTRGCSQGRQRSAVERRAPPRFRGRSPGQAGALWRAFLYYVCEVCVASYIMYTAMRHGVRVLLLPLDAYWGAG